MKSIDRVVLTVALALIFLGINYYVFREKADHLYLWVLVSYLYVMNILKK